MLRTGIAAFGIDDGEADGGADAILRAAVETAGAGGRTTADGIELAQILRDRPDVFAAFFTEYYGANNDRHSDAWTNRVGGATPEDYANYWYETYGKQGDYRPAAAGAPEPEPKPDPQPEPGSRPPPTVEDVLRDLEADRTPTDEVTMPPPQAPAEPQPAVWRPPTAEDIARDIAADATPYDDAVILAVGKALIDAGAFELA